MYIQNETSQQSRYWVLNIGNGHEIFVVAKLRP